MLAIKLMVSDLVWDENLKLLVVTFAVLNII